MEFQDFVALRSPNLHIQISYCKSAHANYKLNVHAKQPCRAAAAALHTLTRYASIVWLIG